MGQLRGRYGKPVVNDPLQFAAGSFANIKTVNKFGRCSDVDTGLRTDITDTSTGASRDWIAPTEARIHAIESDNTADKAAGTGARQGYGIRLAVVGFSGDFRGGNAGRPSTDEYGKFVCNYPQNACEFLRCHGERRDDHGDCCDRCDCDRADTPRRGTNPDGSLRHRIKARCVYDAVLRFSEQRQRSVKCQPDALAEHQPRIIQWVYNEANDWIKYRGCQLNKSQLQPLPKNSVAPVLSRWRLQLPAQTQTAAQALTCWWWIK